MIVPDGAGDSIKDSLPVITIAERLDHGLVVSSTCNCCKILAQTNSFQQNIISSFSAVSYETASCSLLIKASQPMVDG